MQDLLKTLKKTKISLPDYNFEEDIQSRILLKTLNTEELKVLEEILFSSLQFSIESLADSLDLDVDTVYKYLEKLAPLNLFNFDGRMISVDKEKRKYFETQITRFEEDFEPNLDFFQNSLKCLPIEVLPSWYHVPRTSNNIFQSLIDKHLLTPQIFSRYIIDHTSVNELSALVAKEIFDSTDLMIPAADIMKKYDLTRKEFEELALELEFHILAFVSYKDGVEVLTPFHEWREYQLSLKQNKNVTLEDVTPLRPYEFAFIQDMLELTQLLEKTNIDTFFLKEKDMWVAEPTALTLIQTLIPASKDYVSKLINKLLTLGLAVVEETSLKPTKAAKEWCNIPIMQRAHITFKHPHNMISMQKVSSLATSRSIIEIQKSLSSIKDAGWIYFDDFISFALIALNEDKQVILRKNGRSWSYALPKYSEEEKEFIKQVVTEWLFESGVTQVGHKDEKLAFRLTSLGRSIVD
jgi:hypothetical protein